MRRAVLVMAGIALAVGCDRAADRVPTMVSRRLAEELAARRGAREAPAATVGDVTRYVLAELPVVPLNADGSLQEVRVDAAGDAVVKLECPAHLVGQRLVAKAVVVHTIEEAAGVRRLVSGTLRRAEEIRCPTPVEDTPSLRLRGLQPGATAWLAVTGHLAPPSRVETDWLTLEPGARLRLALGIATPREAVDERASHFTVRAEGREGAAVAVLTATLEPATAPEDREWKELEIALDGARRRVGDQVRLVFENDTTALAFPAWGDPTIVVPRPLPQKERRRNVVLVSIDALRADRLGCYGFPHPTTPNLDRLAAEGTLFEQAITQANWTLPAHATMLTGVNPCVHGQSGFDQRGRGLRPLPAAIAPLAELLRLAGWATGAFTEDGYVDPIVFQRGFGVFRANTHAGTIEPTGLVEDTMEAALRWIRENADAPFFVFVHTYQVHAPYAPPPRFREVFAGAPGTPAGDGIPPRPDMAADAAAYASEVRYTDEVLGGLIRGLGDLGLAERTLLVVTSDHGEAFGEHGTTRHGIGLSEEDIRVPLLWRAPGLVTAGRRVNALVGLVDVSPTVLDLLGLSVPPWMQGLSLKGLLSGASGSGHALAGRVLSSESMLGMTALRAQSWKAVFRKGRPTIFRLDIDPHEHDPERKSPLEPVVRRARADLDEECRRVRALLEEGQRAGDGGPPAGHSAERERKLRALGYAE